MRRRTGISALVAVVVSVGWLPIRANAEAPAPKLRVTSIHLGQDGRLDGDILRQCDVAGVVTNALQVRTRKWKFRRDKTSGVPQTIDLVLRIDRVVKLGARPPPDVAGTELGITVLRAGAADMNQPFLCREDGFYTTGEAHCARIESCGEKIVDQLAKWLAWKNR